MVEVNKFAVKLGGEAGYGIAEAGKILAKVCVRSGLYTVVTNEYPSLIRGGHNTAHIRVEDREIYSHIKTCDILIALNKETMDLHMQEITPNGAVIYDGAETKIETGRKDVQLCSVPLAQLAREAGGERIVRNTVALGAAFALLQGEFEMLANVIQETYHEKKGSKIASINKKAAELGYSCIKEKYKGPFRNQFKKEKQKQSILLDGNTALCLGAVKAGCKFHAQYPMTPSSGILSYMAQQAMEYNIIVVQPEDEISVINMAIGAAFAGVRSMCATAGGGFALMVEGVGLAAMTETPVVIIVGQRGGPSTGLPTKTEQGDLRFVLHVAQGEFPRVVLAPGDPAECFYEIGNAFNLAEKYQLPVLILTDKYVVDSMFTVPMFDQDKIKIDRGYLITEKQLENWNDFKRYQFTEDGISPRSVPGQKNGIYKAASDEHDEYGYVNEDPENRKKMMQKRFKKLELLQGEIPEPKIYGDKDADIAIIVWGSVKNQAREAIKLLAKENIAAKVIHYLYISPFPAEATRHLLKEARINLLVENNLTSQLGSIIQEHTGIFIQHRLLKSDGLPLSPEEIYLKVKQIRGAYGEI
ncbi:2-oxoacid:acceptor oxidoreductase subunit alpha [Candidatus Woesearchaeota archaeon]|nr:2-oxoacid:acceptor oxidoreductase subunit alpha [Candidatus Woesearchaeota archaeon]